MHPSITSAIPYFTYCLPTYPHKAGHADWGRRVIPLGLTRPRQERIRSGERTCHTGGSKQGGEFSAIGDWPSSACFGHVYGLLGVGNRESCISGGNALWRVAAWLCRPVWCVACCVVNGTPVCCVACACRCAWACGCDWPDRTRTYLNYLRVLMRSRHDSRM